MFVTNVEQLSYDSCVLWQHIVISYMHAGLMLFPLILSKIYITIYDNEVHVRKIE